ncbi:Alpha/Beta hydrolase protein, partial [Diaporthe sp. PMI_573]
WLDSTLGARKGRRKIKVDVWEPPHESSSQSQSKRPAVINFHGGGFVLGQGTDDARWAAAAIAHLGATVFSINYRRAPSYPFPTAVEDCADSIVQICNRADELGIDRDRVILSGFSSGGNLGLASWVMVQDPKRWGYQLSAPQPTVSGIVLFYPLLDWTISRPHKRLSCPRPDLT